MVGRQRALILAALLSCTPSTPPAPRARNAAPTTSPIRDEIASITIDSRCGSSVSACARFERYEAKDRPWAHARGALLSSEEPSISLLPFTSGSMDGAFDDRRTATSIGKMAAKISLIPLFCSMFGDELTPYTRTAKSHHAPPGWIVQEQISGSR